MSAVARALPVGEARPRTQDEFGALLADLRDLALLAPDVVRDEVRALVWSLRDRRKTCYRCATETIGRRRPKASQMAFCGPECAAAEAYESHVRRRPKR